jgi:antitoxin YefM
MAIQTTYTHARANLAALCDAVTANREVVIIHRRGAEDVALIAAEELSGLLETAHLLVAPQLTVVMSTTVPSRVAGPVSDARAARVGPSGAVAPETTAVRALSSHGR